MANEIMNPPDTPAKLFEDAVGNVAAEFAYLREMARIICEDASDLNNLKIESLAFAMGVCAERTLYRLNVFLDSALEAEEKKVSHA